MLYWYSQRHVHEVFIFITIRWREAMLMITIAGSPRNRSFHQVRYHIAMTAQHRRARENPKSLMHTSSFHYRGTTGTCVFYFWFWMLKSQSLHMSSLNKNWHQVKERLTSTCIKQVISKPSNTVGLCYLALYTFFVGFLVKQILLQSKWLFRIIFCDLELVLSFT